MEVILLRTMPNLGYKGEVVAVRNGYANNYLIPNGYAELATGPALKQLKEIIKQTLHKEEKLKRDAMTLGEKLKNLSLVITVKTGVDGKIFGSVTPIQVSCMLQKQGVDIGSKKIKIVNPILEVGTHAVKVELYKDLHVELQVQVKEMV